jgi:glycosyltransferase involved in cell wall biosynthesis
MRIAIFHNFMDNIGGAEILSLTLAQALGADLYSTNIDETKIKKMGFENVNLKSIGRVPINAPFKQQLALHKFRQLNLGNQYDFYIVSGDWAVSALVNHKPNLWYVHSPIREIWDLYKYTRKNNVPIALKPIFDIWVMYNRYLNKKYSRSANKLLCNSYNTKQRIEKYLKLNADIVHPPIDTKKYSPGEYKNYWLSVNRLINYKRIEMQLEAFSKMPEENLVLVGSYEKSKHFKKYAARIEEIKPDNVKILNWIDHRKLIKLYNNCKGFITTAKNEDFGMAPIEAMAAGKPVIAPDEGGYKETVTHGQTGYLLKNINADKIVAAIYKIDQNPSKYKLACLKQASRFDVKIFTSNIKTQIEYQDSNL